jgi:hypothetical protein
MRGMADLLYESARTDRQPWARLYAEGHDWGPAAEYAEQNITFWTRALL